MMPPRMLACAASAIALAGLSLTGGAAAETLRVAAPAPVLDIDPHGPSSLQRETVTVARQIFDSLVLYESMDPVPRLATGWETPDPLTWVFTLRQDVSFHDGSPLTARDVKASIERVAGSGTSQAAAWNELASVEAPDSHTVVVRTTEPVGTMLRNLTIVQIAPADEIEALDGELGGGVRLTGTGPFKLESFNPGQGAVLLANGDYWDGVPTVSRLEFVDIPELTGRMTALYAGEIHATWAVPEDELDGLEADPAVAVEIVPSVVYYYNWMNARREPFDDVRVRRAMWHAVDVERIVEDLFPRTGEVARAPIPETVFGWAPEEPYAYDPDKARDLLAEAGYPDGFETSIQWSQHFSPQVGLVALSMISDWAEIGVRVEPLEKERAVWLNDLRELNWDMNIGTNPAQTEDADNTLGRLYLSENERTGYANPELDELLLRARAETDQDKRRELYAEASRIIWEEAVGIFPADLMTVYAHRADVAGIEMNATETPRFHRVTLD